MKRKRFAVCISIVIICICVIGIYMKSGPVKTDDPITTLENNDMIQNQERVEFTISIPKSELSESIYSPEGQSFSENEIVVYQTETTSIYLQKVMPLAEDDSQQVFLFNFSYDLPATGSFLTPYLAENGAARTYFGLINSDLTDDHKIYTGAVSLRGHGPDKQIEFYIDADVCKKVVGTMGFRMYCNKVSYSGEQ